LDLGDGPPVRLQTSTLCNATTTELFISCTNNKESPDRNIGGFFY
jgi:hypothetical protein